MIFYKNLKKHKKTQEKNLVFSIFGDGVVSNEDDALAKPNACKDSFNLRFSDGALKRDLDLEIFKSLLQRTICKLAILLILLKNWTKLTGFGWIDGITQMSRDMFILCL